MSISQKISKTAQARKDIQKLYKNLSVQDFTIDDKNNPYATIDAQK